MPQITDDELGKLWALVDHLGFDLEPSILIGGWATQLRVGGEVSRDIDLIINDVALRAKLHEVLDDYSENTIHSGGRKGRGTVNGIHVDAYIPYESALGTRLMLRVERLAKYTDQQIARGWLLLTIEAHLATKLAALLDRAHTEKGAKDAREIVRLLDAGVSTATTVAILIDTTGGPPDELPSHIATAFGQLPDLADLNRKQRKHYASLRREWVDETERQVRRATKA